MNLPSDSFIIFCSILVYNMTKNSKSIFEHIENQELIQKLIDNGFGKLVDAFLSHDGKVYTKKGRLNKSGACRVMKCKAKELEDMLKRCQELLGRELSLDDPVADEESED